MTHPQTLKIDNNGRIFIPAEVRNELALQKGAVVVSWVEDGQLIIKSREAFIKHVREKYRGGSGHEVENFIQERRLEAKKEECLQPSLMPQQS